VQFSCLAGKLLLIRESFVVAGTFCRLLCARLAEAAWKRDTDVAGNQLESLTF